MPLSAGVCLGPYEIVAPLGAGGMGEVYKGRDTRLGRTVAIKVLPAGAAEDPDRRRRFEQEARAASALNHPHICVLHDVGSAPVGSGREARTCDYLVMEYLDGQTLAERLTKGALPLALALEYAIQIADALAKAHRQGIVHRDLKPGNVMITKEGAKLLDFGLARLTQASGATGASATISATGTIAGTVPYMAPEQVQGQPTDARTDLFAFGAVLYEMLTGRRAFEGTSPASVAAAILEHEPPALSSLQPVAPPGLDRVVGQCLAKDPDERWQSAADVKRELGWIADQRQLAQAPASAERMEVAPGLSAVPRSRRVWRALRSGAAAVLLVAATAALTWMLVGRREPQSPPVRQFLIDTQPAEGLRGSDPSERSMGLNRPSRTAIALSPDGSWLVFSAVRGDVLRLYRRKLSEAVAVPLEGTEGADNPFFSPDGTWIGFWARDALWKIRLEGGPPVELCAAPHIKGASWSIKDVIAFGTSAVYTVPAAGGTAKALTRLDAARGERFHVLPHFLPDGETLLFTVMRSSFAPRSASTEAMSLATGARHLVMAGAVDARYLPSGHIVYARLGRLEAAAFDPRRLAVTGTAVGLIPDVMQALNASTGFLDTGAAQFTTDRTGTLVYVAGGILPDHVREFVWVDRRGTPETLPIPPGPYATPRLSPDGTRFLYLTIGLDYSLWYYDISRQTSTIIPTWQLQPGWPIWTPDGQRAAFTSRARGPTRLYVVPVNGSAPPASLGGDISAAEASETLGCWTPDGKAVVFLRAIENVPAIWQLRMRDGQPERTVLLRYPATGNREAVMSWPAVSPDGKWLAYVSNESGRNEVYIQRFPVLGGRQQVSREGGRAPVWRRDSRELFYVTEGDPRRMMAADVRLGAALSLGPPRALFDLPAELVTHTQPGPAYDVSQDGQRFLFVRDVPRPLPSPPSQMHVVLNWFEELKAKVPAGK